MVDKLKIELPDENKVLSKIKQDDRRSKKKFVIICLVSGIIGGVAGGTLMTLLDNLGQLDGTFVELWAQLQLSSVTSFRFLLIAIGLLMYCVAFAFYRSAKKLWSIKEQREDNWEIIEKRAGVATSLIGILTVLQSTLFALGMYMLPKTLTQPRQFWTYMFTILAYVFFVFGGVGITKRAVNLLKEMNPGKRGSVYDMKFKDKWYQSCDEAERLQIGVAAYKAYFATTYCCLALTVVLTFLCMMLELGMLPIICVGIVWLTQTVAYQISAYKIAKLSDDKIDA